MQLLLVMIMTTERDVLPRRDLRVPVVYLDNDTNISSLWDLTGNRSRASCGTKSRR